MSDVRAVRGRDDARFRSTVFRAVPLVFLAAAAATAAVAGADWSMALGPLPWVVSLVLVGLPHGAADLATSRRALHGRPLVAIWLGYVATMVAVAAGFAAAPVAVIVAFVAVSCWHFGAADVDADEPADDRRLRPAAALARGCAVLAMPLTAWPVATAQVATEVAALVRGGDGAVGLFSPAAVRAAGIALAAVAVAAGLGAALVEARRPGGLRGWRSTLIDLAVIASLGWFADPLFAVGIYFLVWHAWRQMVPLTGSLCGAAPRSWRELVRGLARVHRDALPLLVPTWAAIGAVWWRSSADHTLRDLAIVSIAAYLVVTPAHELLGELLRSLTERRTTTTGRRPRGGIILVGRGCRAEA